CPQLPSSCAMPVAGVPSFSPDGEMKTQLFGLLACANRTIRGAIYQTSWTCIVDAMAQRLAASSTLTIDLVVDDQECPLTNGTRQCALSAIQNHPRVTIADDQRSDLMHDKFLIVDGQELWVGSPNFTSISFCTDNNNAIIIDRPEIVSAYRGEFDRM